MESASWYIVLRACSSTVSFRLIVSTVHDRPITVFVVCAIFLVGPKPLRALVDDPLARLVTVSDRCVSRDGELISKLSLD